MSMSWSVVQIAWAVWGWRSKSSVGSLAHKSYVVTSRSWPRKKQDVSRCCLAEWWRRFTDSNHLAKCGLRQGNGAAHLTVLDVVEETIRGHGRERLLSGDLVNHHLIQGPLVFTSSLYLESSCRSETACRNGMFLIGQPRTGICDCMSSAVYPQRRNPNHRNRGRSFK